MINEDADAMQKVYTQRNNCAIAFAKAAVAAGWKAGRGIDPAQPSPDWHHVVYIELPNGRQVSYHIAPEQVPMLTGLPVYGGEWDGTYVGRTPDWAGF